MANTKITTRVIADDAITSAQIADNAINSEHYVDGSIDTAHYADNSITGAELADNIVIAGTLGSTGKITADAGIDIDNFNIDGTTIALSSGDLTLDVAADIILDAGGNEIKLKTAGTEWGQIYNSSSDLAIYSSVQDKDIKLQGNDGGSVITALTLDMSDAGKATFNSSVLGTIINAGTLSSVGIGAATADANVAELGAGYLNLGRDDTASSAQISFSKNGIIHSSIVTDNNDLRIKGNNSNLGIRFDGNDGGSAITALRLDMADAGTAIFNHDIKVAASAKIIGAGDLSFDSADDLFIFTRAGGNGRGRLEANEADFSMKCTLNNGDIILKGVDGGQNITALTLDMSAAGAATFNAGVTVAGQTLTTGGAVSAPSYSFIGDTDTGMSRPTGNVLNFISNGVERVRIGGGNGDFEFNTVSNTGSKYFIINQTAGADGGFLLRSNNSNKWQNAFPSSGTLAWYSYTAGATVYTLKANGEILSPPTYANTTSQSANMFVATNGEFVRSTSSKRYKNSITDVTKGLAELKKLRPVNYKGNNDGETVFYGLIAEEVHDAGLTEFVEYNDENQPDALRYPHMVSLCIKAIQELSAQVEELKAKLEDK